MVMMRILKHGNNKGYSFIDACIAIFITGTLLLAVLGFARTVINYSNKITSKIEKYIQNQNDYSHDWLESFEK